MRKLAAILAFVLLAGCWEREARHGGGDPVLPVRPAPVAPFRMGRPDAVLLITGGGCGMMEACNCRGRMPGGLARRSGLVQSYRSAFHATFCLDGGDAFWVDPQDVRNQFVVRGYEQIGYDAMVLGDQEWAASNAYLRRLLRADSTPYLSSTVAPADEQDALPLVRQVVRQLGRLRLAVISDVRKDAFMFLPAARLECLSFASGRQLAERAAALKAQGCVVVVVSHMGDDLVQRTAEEIPADIIVRSHTARSSDRVETIGGRPTVSVGGAEHVGVLAIRAGAEGQAEELEYRLELVDDRWPIDQRLIQTYQAYSRAAMRAALDTERTEGLRYVPSNTCGQCHASQFAAWRGTRHARAYATLVEAGRQGDPNCLMCHATGFGTQQGFRTIDETPELAGVNCQDCHRFNVDEHQRSSFKAPKPGRNLCTSCHTPVTDPAFEFEARSVGVRCPSD